MTPDDRLLAEGILFTDLYQLTMAQVYHRTGLHESPAQFDHFFRSYPDYGLHQAGYCINAGLEWLVDWMRQTRTGEREIACLRALRGRGDQPLFDEAFLGWLAEHGSFEEISMWAIPEGRVVHPNVPLTVVQGPLAMAQILESALLCRLNYATLVATKAARIRQSGQLLLEFGMRRAHDTGAIAGARAALIGGADFSSNTGVSCVLGVPPRGTHGHSLVQAFIALGGSELDAFRAYAEIYPDDCVLLVDTVDTLASGVPNAIRVFEELRQKGHRPAGIRLDSGDLAYLSIRSARMLDDAGFREAGIVLSNQLDELVLLQVIAQIQEEASRYGVDPDALIARLAYGVGTQLITSAGDAALDGVYKLVALGGADGWRPTVKVSETPAKATNPGPKGVWRLYDRRDKAIADLLALADEDPRAAERLTLHHALQSGTFQTIARAELSAIEPLHVQVLDRGRLVGCLPSLADIRRQRDRDIEHLDPGVRRIVNPHTYHVSLTDGLNDLKNQMIRGVRS